MIWLVIAGVIILAFDFVVFFGAPYVPSRKKYIKRAFDQLYKVSAKDVLVDVGSGDGIVLKVASEYGASAIGYEINPLLVMISRLRLRRLKKVTIELANFWRVSLPPKTTIVYVFAVSRDVLRLSYKLQEEVTKLGRPISVLCYGSPLKDRVPDKMFEAYSLYTFRPLQAEKAQV